MHPKRPWVPLGISVQANARALFDVSVVTIISDGKATLFWSGRWLQRRSLLDLAPHLVPFVAKKAFAGRTVFEALQNCCWIRDIRASLPLPTLVEYIRVWDTLKGVVLTEGCPDHHLWLLLVSGAFSTRSAYPWFFAGSIAFEPFERIGRHGCL